MNIDANAVINKLNSKLADANLQITVLELQVEQLEKAQAQNEEQKKSLEEPEIVHPKDEVK